MPSKVEHRQSAYIGKNFLIATALKFRFRIVYVQSAHIWRDNLLFAYILLAFIAKPTLHLLHKSSIRKTFITVGPYASRKLAAKEQLYDTSLCFQKNVTETNFQGRSTINLLYSDSLGEATSKGLLAAERGEAFNTDGPCSGTAWRVE